MGSAAIIAIAGAAGWAVLSQPGALAPAEFSHDGALQSPDVMTAEAADGDAEDSKTSMGLAKETGDPDTHYESGLAVLQKSWDQGESSRLLDAVERIRKAAEQDHVRAQLFLGALYEKGRGVIQDDVAASNWYRRAAMRGDASAMFRMGKMLMAGRGSERNLVEAYMWLNLAAARGDRDAETERNRVRSLLSSTELMQAQERTRRFDLELPRYADTSTPLPAGF